MPIVQSFRCDGGVVPSSSLSILTASADQRSLVVNGNPIFIQGNGNAQFLQGLNPIDLATFLNSAQSQGFNGMWLNCVANAQDGGFLPADGSNYNGDRPFTGTLDGTTVDGGPNYDLTTPNSIYWRYIDAIINACWARNMYVWLDIWDNDSYADVYTNNGNTKCQTFGAFIGARYKSFTNVVYMIGNDFQNNTNVTAQGIAISMWTGIVSQDTSKLQTMELNFNMSGALDNANYVPYITLTNAFTYYPVYYQVGQEYASTAKTVPCFLSETFYEGIQAIGITPTAKTMRLVAYESTCAGGIAGYFFGSTLVFFGTGWQSNGALTSTGTVQTAIWGAFFRSMAFQKLVPDTAHAVVTAGYGTASGNNTGTIDTDTYCPCAAAADGSLMVTVVPVATTLTVASTKFRGTYTARWFDPTNATYTAIGSFPNTGTQNFTKPGNNTGGDTDWILRCDA